MWDKCFLFLYVKEYVRILLKSANVFSYIVQAELVFVE